MGKVDAAEDEGLQSSSGPTLSIIVPVYNEEENFPALVDQIDRVVPPPRNLYVVYDRDEDTTLPVARQLAAKHPWLKLVKNDKGVGVIHALKTAFEHVPKGPAVVVMADLSDDLSQLPKMLKLYEQGNRIVCPSRYVRGGRQVGGPPLKRWFSRLAGLSLHWLVGFPTHDATNNFRLYDVELVRELGIESSGGFELALELTAKAFRRGVPIAELPTTWKDRTAGSSRFRLFAWLPRYLRWYFYALGSGRVTSPKVD